VPEERRPLDLVRRGTVMVLAVQVAGAGIAYAQQVVLAQVLGASSYGVYTYVFLYAGFAALLAGLGLPAASIRFVPAYAAAGDHEALSAFVRRAARVTYMSAIIGTAAALVIGWSLHTTTVLRDPAALLIGAVLVPALAGSILKTELARARQRMLLAYVGPFIIRPTLILAVVLVLSRGAHLSAVAALTATAVTAYTTLALQHALTKRLFSRAAPRRRATRAETRAWRGVGLSLLAVSAFVIVLMQLDIVIVGAILGSRDAGIYAAASKTAALVSFVILAVNGAAAPQFAALWEEGRRDELRRLVARLAGIIFWPSLLIALGLALLASPILDLFGPSFDEARGALLILLAGQLINAAAGSVGYLLTVTGHHRVAARALGASAVVFIILTAAGTALDGLVGAALGSMAGFLVWNVALGRLVVTRLRIWPAFIRPPRAVEVYLGR
jgi:O-antigen/teichoic acid export membrane protein